MDNMENFKKVVLAGMKLMYDKNVFERTKAGMLRKNVPLPQRLAVETAGLMKVLMDKSQGKIPPALIAPAASMLLMEMGKFMAEAGIEEPTPEQIREGTKILMELLKRLFAPKQGQPVPQQPATPPAAPPQQVAPAQPAGIMQGV